ncbi:hypothetical protein S40288_04512 [Stachybotrys chartarum IBT 40288]|nr:hypothetical protein S40288_04512 [Stachybotrys chartarum IBT 40288]
MSTTTAQAVALVTGSFLSGTSLRVLSGNVDMTNDGLGAMASLSLIAVPVFLDSTTSAPQLFHTWTRMYHYGHQALPTMAVGTLSLWTYVAIRRRRIRKDWHVFALAGVVTVLMLPFTWLVMVPTNNTLFGLEAAGSDLGNVTLTDGKMLVVSWAWMHLARSVFPLAGAALGAAATFRDWAR